MESELIIRYFHFLGIIVMGALITVEHLMLKGSIVPEQLKSLRRIDAVLGISAAVVFFCGIALLLWVGKPAVFYSKNWIFHFKFTLFLLAAIVSVYPTIFLIKASRQVKEGVAEIAVPKGIVMALRFELTALLIIPFLAVLMARGVGL